MTKLAVTAFLATTAASSIAFAQAPQVTYPSDPTEPVHAELPKELPYDDYTAIPPGYQVEEHRIKGLLIAGPTVIGGTYLLSAVLGGALRNFCIFGPCEPDTRFDWMFVPIVGPSITGVEVGGGIAALGWGLTIAQSSGVAMLIAGLVTKRSSLVLQEGDGDWQGQVELVPSLNGARVDVSF